ncbi:hypothetical protein DRQ09_05430 [candidate division KSB1 bacterium]|nr:MAG: hypothetical protein DRQ09_05430 [candidate division KSB1 bacterium]
MTTRRPKLELLDENFEKLIISSAYYVLKKQGIYIENNEALQILESSGIKVDFKDSKAYFNENDIEKALSSVPKSINIYDREENLSLVLEKDNVYFNPGSAALNILDYPSKSIRKAETDDLINFSALTDRLEYIKAQSTGIISSDVPEEIADSYRLLIALLYCRKPVITGIFSTDGIQLMFKMLEVIRGDSNNLKEKPLAIFDACPSPPLKWSKLTCQSVIECAKVGIPTEFVSMPLSGATAPVTLAGTLVQHTAETLSGIVISQAVKPGAPVIYGGSPSAFDMRKGTTPMGAIETMMIDVAYSQIGKKFGLPTHAYMGLSDAKILDSQAGIESATGAVLAALAGINVVSGPGMLNFESTQSLEKLVIDNEICGMALRLIEGIARRGENLTEDLIGNIYKGDHFLSSPLTIKWHKKEYFSPSDVIDRNVLGGEGKILEKNAGERAHETVQKILKKKPEPSLDKNKIKELVSIMKTATGNHKLKLFDKLKVL